jgi:transposase
VSLANSNNAALLYVGLDLHVRNSYLHISDGCGQVLRRGRVGNTLAELGQFLAEANPGGRPVLVSLESTTNSRAMCRLLELYGRQAGVDLTSQVLDARKLRVIAESVAKCDKLDAAVLGELSRSNLKLPACYIPDDEVFALREHLRARSDLVRIRTMLKNRVHAVLHRRGVLAPKGDLFAGLGREFLGQLELDEAGREILLRLLEALDGIGASLAASERSLTEVAKRERWAKPLALLRSMPGVGPVVGLTVLAELGDIGRFAGRAAVSNYSGLVPVVRDSNDKHYGGGITRRGPAHLRAVLVQAAWVAINKVPRYAQAFAGVAGKRGRQAAIVAVARRMLEDMWTMLRKDEAFRYTRGGQQPAPSKAG